MDHETSVIFWRSGSKVYRFDHQVKTLQRIVDLKTNANILDYGCAKSSTLKKLYDERKDITPHVFDVSDQYRKYWNLFVDQKNQACYNIPLEWEKKFDLVTSFFSLEHASKPNDFLTKVYSILNEDGVFYCIVPDWQKNIADAIVVLSLIHI